MASNSGDIVVERKDMAVDKKRQGRCNCGNLVGFSYGMCGWRLGSRR